MSAERDRIRCFFGVAPDAGLQAELIGQTRRLEGADWGHGVRWLPPESLHLTLRFLGEVDRSVVEALGARARDQLVVQEPCEVPFVGVAPFPTPRRPRVIAALLRDDARLSGLVAAIEETVVASGLPAEPRRFRPHITLGRVRGRSPGAIRFEADRIVASLRVEHVMLYRSVLEQSGARYSVIEQIALAGRRTKPAGGA